MTLLVASEVRAQPQRLPSEVLHDIARGRLEHPRWTPVQAESAGKPLLAAVRTTGLSAEEEVALGLAYFYTFDGLSARPFFEKHRLRDDALGRVSSQSLQMMTFFGQKDYALVEQRLVEYRTRFAPTIDDTEYTYGMVNNLSWLAATKGNHTRAVDLVLEDVQQLPIDVPFRSFELFALRYPSFQATGRTTEAITWMKRHRDALRAASLGDSAAVQLSAADGTRLPHRAGVYHFTVFTDLLFPDDPRWTREGALRFQRRQAVDKFTKWIEAAETGLAVP